MTEVTEMDAIDGMDILAQALSEVFEVQAFMFTEEVEPSEIESPEGALWKTSIYFSGCDSGVMELTFPDDLAVELAANTLGVEAEEVRTETAQDALKEFANVVCGQFLTRQYGNRQVFKLSMPNIESLSADLWEQLTADRGAVLLKVEEKSVVGRVEIEAG